MNTSVMNSFFLTRSLLGLALFAVGLTSCQDDPNQLVTPDTETGPKVTPEIQAKMDFIRAAAGLTDQSIVYRKDEFVVADRILISEEDTDLRMAAAGATNARTEQQRSDSYLVDPLRVRDIKVAFGAPLNSRWRSAFTTAIEAWNDAGSAVRFRVVSASDSYDILATRDDPEGDVVSSFPLFNGAPGPEITVDQAGSPNVSDNQVIRLAAFALGTTVGLTSSNSGSYIEGTPERDPESVMDPNIRTIDTPFALSEGDQAAVRTLYPAGQSVSTLSVGESLAYGQSLNSENDRYRFAVQPDGNLVIYDTSGSGAFELGQPIWASQTSSSPRPQRVRLDVQPDGNVVLYGEDGSPRWATMTDGTPATRLVMQDDGNLVLYGDDGTPYWASQTAR